MPAAPIVGAVIAVAAAAEIATPVAIGLAVVATAGAVASTVGTITGDKTLSMVGNIMGAVGSIGGIANGLNLFGEVAGGLTGVTNAAGGAAESVAPTAMSVSEATGGLNAYTPEFLQAANDSISNTGAFAVNASAGAGAQAASQPGQIVNMLSGEVAQVPVPTAEAPAAALGVPDVQAPAATNVAVSPEGIAQDPASALDPTKGLINAEPPPQVGPSDFTMPDNSGVPMVDSGGNPALNYADGSTMDPNAMAQGDIPDGTGMGSTSPAGQDGVMANRSLINGGTQQPSFEPSNGPDPVTGSRQGAYGDASASAPTGNAPAMQPSKVAVTGKTGPETPAPQPAQAPAAAPAAPPAGAGNTPSLDAMLSWKDAKPGDITRADSSLWGELLSFAKENKSLVLGGMMSLGSFMSGALSPKTPAEVEALNAQAEKNRAAAALENTQNQLMQRRLNNMSQPLPVAYRGGLINMPQVTGRV